MLQKLVESYNTIILQQFESFYLNENEKEKELAFRIQEQQALADDLISKRLEFDRKLDNIRVLVSSKDALISSIQRNEDILEKEIFYLKEQLKEYETLQL